MAGENPTENEVPSLQLERQAHPDAAEVNSDSDISAVGSNSIYSENGRIRVIGAEGGRLSSPKEDKLRSEYPLEDWLNNQGVSIPAGKSANWSIKSASGDTRVKYDEVCYVTELIDSETGQPLDPNSMKAKKIEEFITVNSHGTNELGKDERISNRFDTNHPPILVNNGKLVVFINEEGEKIAFKTVDETGETISPSEWTRFSEHTASGDPDVTDAFGKLSQLNIAGKSNVSLDGNRLASFDGTVVKIFNLEDGTNLAEASISNPVFTKCHRGLCYGSKDDPSKLYFTEFDHTNRAEQREIALPADLQANGKITKIDDAPMGAVIGVLSENGVLSFVNSQTGETLEQTMEGVRDFTIGEERIQIVKSDNKVETYKGNIKDISEAIGVAQTVAGIDVSALRAKGNVPDAGISAAIKPQLDSKSDEIYADFEAEISSATTKEDFSGIEAEILSVEAKLKSGGAEENHVRYMLYKTRIALEQKRENQVNDLISEVQAAVIDIERPSQLDALTPRLAELREISGGAAESIRARANDVLESAVDLKTTLYKEHESGIKSDLEMVEEEMQQQLAAVTRHGDFVTWYEGPRLDIQQKLYDLRREAPKEALVARQMITEKLAQLQEIWTEKKNSFKVQREDEVAQASNEMQIRVENIENDIDLFFDMIRDESSLKNREQIQAKIDDSDAYKAIIRHIEDIKEEDPNIAALLSSYLKRTQATTTNQMLRQKSVKLDKHGQRFVSFGETHVPVMDTVVKRERGKIANLQWVVNRDTLASGDPKGHIGILVRDSDGKETSLPLWGDSGSEQWFGVLGATYKDRELDTAYVGKDQFKKMSKLLSEWMNGGDLKTKHDQMRADLKKTHATHRDLKNLEKAFSAILIDEKDESGKLEKLLETLTSRFPEDPRFAEISAAFEPLGDEESAESSNEKFFASIQDIIVKLQADLGEGKYTEMFKEFADFCNENQIPHVRKAAREIREITKEKVTTNGRVPKISPKIKISASVEADLEEMADNFNYQIEEESGVLMLKGHTGTGKDVRLEIYANRTNRPYYKFNCSKWTTEKDLTTKIVLEDGNTVPIPSVVVEGMQVPGALIYFNEFNALAPQTQVFLNSLTDGSRSLTIQGPNGNKTIKAAPGVILSASSNPNYPGTYPVALASKDRMQEMDIGYEKLTRNGDVSLGEDPNRKYYDANEALIMAGSVQSLEGLTYEEDMKANEFIKAWDINVNGTSREGAPDLTELEKFHLEVILEIMKISDIIRYNFVRTMTGSLPAPGTFVASQEIAQMDQPASLRRMAEMAYDMKRYTDTSKNPVDVAMELINRRYLMKYDEAVLRDKLGKELKNAVGQLPKPDGVA